MPQFTVEAVLRERVETFPSVKIAFNTELVAAEQSDGEVAARVRDVTDGKERIVRAKYLIGADGARSNVRSIMGAKMEGEHAYGINYSLIMRVPELVRAAQPARHNVLAHQQETPAVMGPMVVNVGTST